MSPESSPLNASQAVERIREIIVGRHLERLEQRVARLETSDVPGSSYPQLDERVLIAEARMEALQHSVARLSDHTRDELERRTYLQREEIQRLSQQIQQVAATRPATVEALPAVQHLEQRLGTWLGAWKDSVQGHLNSRDQQISDHIRSEIDGLKTAIEGRMTDLENRLPDSALIEQRFKKIAEAARALAESISQLPPIPSADASPP
jgi:chromosome condensin MukBEF ATPase and DNA-binding subunit MukB